MSVHTLSQQLLAKTMAGSYHIRVGLLVIQRPPASPASALSCLFLIAIEKRLFPIVFYLFIFGKAAKPADNRLEAFAIVFVCIAIFARSSWTGPKLEYKFRVGHV